MTFRPLPILSLFCAATFALLLLLGQWQWTRFEEKRAAAAIEPPTVALVVERSYPERAQYVFGAWRGRGGWRAFVPVETAEGVVFVDVGFVAGVTPPEAPPDVPSPGPLTGVRLVPSAPGAFANPPDLTRRAWYHPDLEAMGRAAGFDAVAPWALALPYRDEAGDLQSNPFLPGADPLPPERHFGYALTWWGLAAALLVMYLVFHARVGRLRFGR